MEEDLVDEKISNEHEVVVLKKNTPAKKVLIFIIKLLILFIMPIMVAILDHFVF
ncbi:MAG: hypothetical protein ACFFBH_13695 [Promethearchaeota archaeon]